jgi:hypothetical protein
MDEPIVETSAPVTTPTESSATATVATSRPTSAAEAFAQVTATPDPIATETDTATTAPVATTAQTEQPVEKKGPIPFEVHSKALENARSKAADEALAKHREAYGWAEQVDRSHIEQMAKMGELYQKDRGAFTRQFFAEALADQDLAPIIRSEAARMLGSRNPAQSEQVADIEPDIPVMDMDGREVTRTFSGTKVMEIIAPLRKEIADLKQQLGPIHQDHESRAKQARDEAQKQEESAALQSRVDADLKFVTSRAKFAEHKADILAVYNSEKYLANPNLTLRDAYDEVIDTKVLPLYDKKAEARVRESFLHKQAGQTVDGSGAAASTPQRPRTVAELSAHMRQTAAR